MKIQILSDLHLEFAEFVPPHTGADVVVLAGDIHTRGRGATWAARHFEVPIVYVAGNHEHYGSNMATTMRDLKQIAAQFPHLHVLENESVVIDGVRFMGATLWTDYRLTGNEVLAQWDAQSTITDFRKIRDDRYKRITPSLIANIHARSRAFLHSSLEEEFHGPTIVVTHHAPSEFSVHERYRQTSTRPGGGSHLSASYASRLDGLMGHAALWVHGHTHDSFDYEISGTRVRCNPRGYAPDDLNPDFDPALVVEVDYSTKPEDHPRQ